MSYPSINLEANTSKVYEINKSGELQNAYSPLQNLVTDEDLGDFTTEGLTLSPNNPVDIILTDEYDGSQNLILNDDVNEPRLINSRMSVQENHMFLIPEHSGNNVTNVYTNETLNKDISLLKLYNNIPTLSFNGLLEGGALPCGSYTFYFNLADADGNLTNTIQESGIITVHIGTIGTTKVRMGMQNENSDKQVSLTLSGIDSGFDYVRVFYERSSSGNDGAITPLFYMIDQNYPIIGNKAEIVITGEETILGVSKSDLQNEFADISAAKTQVVLHNTLFMGNVQSTNYDYGKLQQLAWKIIPREVSPEEAEMKIGGITGNYDLLSAEGSERGLYYSIKNQYYYTGYWPDEYYRFGVVFIFNNNMTSPVFNIQGVDFSLLKDKYGRSINSWEETYFDTYKSILIPEPNDPYSSEPENYIFNPTYMTNSKGVVKFSKRQVLDGVEDTFVPNVYGIKFDLSCIDCGESTTSNGNVDYKEILKKYNIKGLFFVRQKRIPSTLAQGIVIGLTDKEHGSLPVIKNKDGVWNTYSFLGPDRLLHPTGSEVEIPGKNVSNRALLVPDFELNTATYNQIFTSNTFALERVATIGLSQFGNTVLPKNYLIPDEKREISKVTAVPQDSLTKTDGTNYFATIAGLPEEPYKTEDVIYSWNETAPQNLTTSTSVVRGKWGAYVGISSDKFDYGDIVNIKDDLYLTNSNYNLLQFQKRFTDFSSYSAISPRHNYDDQEVYTCYRGDCFPSMFTHRMMSNFQDPELPTNHKIIDPGCWAKNYAVRCTAEILADTHSNLTDDSAGWYIPSPVNKKSNVVSLIFGILTGNIGTVINAIASMTDTTPRPVQTQFANEIAQAFEVYTGVDGQSDEQKTYNSTLYSDINGLEETVAAGYIKKVNPKEQESNSTGFNIKALFKSDDKWELHGLSQINRADVNAVSFGQWITFPVCSSSNLAFRDVDFTQATEEAKYNRKRSFYPLEEKDISNNLNESQVINGAARKSIAKVQTPAYRTTPFMKQEFFNRIYWSKPNVTDNIINSYRMVFRDQYREYNKEFGSITKLEALGDNLVVIFQHGIGMLPVDRSIKSEADATPYLASRNVLPAQVSIITSDYGSMWKDSILKVPDSPVLFGVDTVAKKIWKLSTNGIEFISDHVVTKFLNDFIDLSEYDFEEYQGHVNVKTHYNAFKKDVIFTYYKDVWDSENQVWKDGTTWSLCYNLVTNTFTTFYDWIPVESCNIDNIYFSFDRDQMDSVLDKKADEVKVYPVVLKDGSEETAFYQLTKALIDPQFSEKCKVYPVTTKTYQLEGQSDQGWYLCYYIKDQEGWKFQYTEIKSPSDFTINTAGVECVADLKTVQLKTGVTTKAELPESDPMHLYNLRNSTPNRMLLWKHGQAGLYDNQGKIKPTFWYGKPHEFNFEFVVNENPVKQKIFNNLKLLANKVAPAKFEYEVVGEGYEWFEFKPIVEWINKKSIEDPSIDWWKCTLNRTSKDIVKGDASWAACPDFPSLFDENRVIKKLPYLKMKHTDKKGTPERPHYKWDGGQTYWSGLSTDIKEDKYSYNCSEPCLVEDDQLNEVRIRTESLGNDMKKYGRIRGNMQYLEDLWNVEIRPLQITWCYKEDDELKFKKLSETRHRDKYIKIKVRYSGEDLALIQAIYTIFEDSYA